MRLKEWFSWHFPELAKIVTENTTYCQIVDFIQERSGATADKLEGLEEITKDPAVAEEIVQAAKNSMGQDFSIDDHVILF